MISTQGVTEKFGTFFRFAKRNSDSNIEEMIWVHLLSHIYENPLKTEVDLFAIKTSVW